MVFFALGACRFGAADRPIPGSNDETRHWTLDQYRELVRTYQGPQIQIVETLDEQVSESRADLPLRLKGPHE